MLNWINTQLKLYEGHPSKTYTHIFKERRISLANTDCPRLAFYQDVSVRRAQYEREKLMGINQQNMLFPPIVSEMIKPN